MNKHLDTILANCVVLLVLLVCLSVSFGFILGMQVQQSYPEAPAPPDGLGHLGLYLRHNQKMLKQNYDRKP